jgi:TonB family protein
MLQSYSIKQCLLLLLSLEVAFQGANTRTWEPDRFESMSYPHGPRYARISGPVKLEVKVSSQGLVVSTRTLSGHKLLANACARAVQSWHFRPSCGEGDLADTVILEWNFVLKGSCRESCQEWFVVELPNKFIVKAESPELMP